MALHAYHREVPVCHPEPVEGRPSLARTEITIHYALVAPLMEKIFGRIPIVWTTPPFDKLRMTQANQPPIYHAKFFGHYSHLSSEHVQHLASIGAQEFYSWFPLVDDPARARFARFLLERQWDDPTAASEDDVRTSAQILHELLEADGFGAIPVVDGVGGVSIFVPLANGPSYADVRAWAHALARKAIAANPNLFSEAPNTHADSRVHIHVSSNAEGRWSILPYSLRGGTGRVATPVSWEELQTIEMRGTSIEDFASRLAAKGDVFGDEVAAVPARPIPAARTAPLMYRSADANVRGAIVQAAIAVLSDGKTRTAEEILDIRSRAWPN